MFLSPYFQVDGTPVWDIVPELLDGLDALAKEKPIGMAPLEGYRDTINAWASIVIPADKKVFGDKAAGDMVDPTNGEKISEQIIRWVRGGELFGTGTKITEFDAQSVFHTLDLETRARFKGVFRFSLLNTKQQSTLVQDLVQGKFGQIKKAQAHLVVRATHLSYWTNWPEHRVRRTPMGMGVPHDVSELDIADLEGARFRSAGKVAMSNPSEGISSPNDPGSGTAFDYARWHYPLKKDIEDLVTTAMLEAEAQPEASEAALEQLVAKGKDQTLYFGRVKKYLV